MLSVKQILRIGKLLEQSGEPRPGFLHDETDNFEGTGSALEHGALATASHANPQFEGDAIRVELAYEVDEKTGDVRLVQK